MSRFVAPMLLLIVSGLPIAAAPPARGVPLSEILGRIEAQPGFIYVQSVAWRSSGWEIVYYRGSGIVTVIVDPRTGRIRAS